MRTALASKSRRPGAQVSVVRSFPPPVKGWVTRKALASMRPDEAIVLDNWFPYQSYVEIRGGNTEHATDLTGNGKTLAIHNALNGTNKMFCLTASGVYDVSSAGAVGSSVASRTNGKHQWVMFGDGTNNWLILCNGVDKPLYYDGTNWVVVDGSSSPALTGVTTTTLIAPFLFKGRLIFLQVDSMSFWYLSAGAAGGSLTEFDLAGEAKRGGYLIAAASWTIDAGDGIDDRAVFITSEGEAIVYQGTDPSDASKWAKIGTYFLGRPLGRRCMCQYGGDLIVLTENGAFPLSAALQAATIDFKLALSFNIEPSFNSAARDYDGNFGWKAIVYPAQSALIVNVPVAEDGAHYQYVMNTTTKAWCRFLEWDAEDFAVFNGELYFCHETFVYKAWTGRIDDTDNIEAYAKQAFNYFGEPGITKHFKLFRPVLAVNGTLQFLTDIDVDFQDTVISGIATYTVTSGSSWDVNDWDEATWAAGLETIRRWKSPRQWEGYCGAVKVKIATNELQVQWMASDVIYERGAAL